MNISQLLNPELERPATSRSGAKDRTPDLNCVTVEADEWSGQARYAVVPATPTFAASVLPASAAWSPSTSGSRSFSTAMTQTTTASAPPAISSPERTPGSWTQKEYEILLKLRLHSWPWDRISDSLPGRSAEACRKRWENTCGIAANLHPHWVSEEEEILVALKDRGYGWSEIATYLPARTPDGCKNRWYERHYENLQKAAPGCNVSPDPNIKSRTISGRPGRRPSQGSDRTVCRHHHAIRPALRTATPQQHGHAAIKHRKVTRLRRLAPKPEARVEAPRQAAFLEVQDDRNRPDSHTTGVSDARTVGAQYAWYRQVWVKEFGLPDRP